MSQSPERSDPSADPRRRIPRTDHLLAHPQVGRASDSLSERVVRDIVRAAQDRARRGEIPPEEVLDEILSAVGGRPAASLRPVLNATGIIVHTNLGRAPLSAAARGAVQAAAGYTDVEFDLGTGARARRGAGARAALLAACPEAEDALVVNNGAAALLLATTALAGTGEVVISRGELIEIGAGFRLPDLIASTGARLHEVGTTNRTHLADYTGALGAGTGCVLRIHTSNYRVIGFTSEVEVAELTGPCRAAGVPLVVDLGSGLLAPEPLLPEEPDVAAALRDGADVVIASGDKLLGGPQAGILLGRADVIARLARHPLARAVRADKLALAALEATLTGPVPPVLRCAAPGPGGAARAHRSARGARGRPHRGARRACRRRGRRRGAAARMGGRARERPRGPAAPGGPGDRLHRARRRLPAGSAVHPCERGRAPRRRRRLRPGPRAR